MSTKRTWSKFAKFVTEFRNEYKKLTGRKFLTLKRLNDLKHPDLIGLTQAYDEEMDPKEAAKSYVTME